MVRQQHDRAPSLGSSDRSCTLLWGIASSQQDSAVLSLASMAGGRQGGQQWAFLNRVRHSERVFRCGRLLPLAGGVSRRRVRQHVAEESSSEELSTT